MKKILALLLALVMLLSFAACEADDDSASRRSRRKSSSSETTDEVAADTTAETEEETEEPTEEETEPVEEDEEIIGTISGNTYENEYFGIGVELDKSWVVATHEEAAQILGLTSEYMGVDKLMETSGVFCDLYAMNGSGANVNIMLQKETFLTKNKSDEEYVEFALQASLGTLEQAGFSNIETEIGTMTFAGETYCTVSLSATINGNPVYETMVFIRKNGYMVNITSASNTQGAEVETLELFYKV